MGENATATGLKAFSGSNMHQLVLDIGHFFGHSFKPWEAVKWVKGINVAGKVLGVFGVVFSLGMQIKEDAVSYTHLCAIDGKIDDIINSEKGSRVDGEALYSLGVD